MDVRIHRGRHKDGRSRVILLGWLLNPFFLVTSLEHTLYCCGLAAYCVYINAKHPQQLLEITSRVDLIAVHAIIPISLVFIHR
jgi:hypothetical protein